MNTASQTSTNDQRSTLLRFFRWLFRWRTWRVILFCLFCLVTLVFLFVAEENWRGKRAWERFRIEWEAKGERFDLASVIPKPVPADQNFAMTPFLAPLLDYEFVNGAVQWRDSNGLARAKSVSIFRGETSRKKSPPAGNWQRGEFCDLKAWQEFYRGNTNYPASPQPLDPAHDVLFALGAYGAVLAELRAASQRPFAVFPIHYSETFFSQLDHLSVLKGVAQVARLRALANLDAGKNEEALADLKLAFHLAESLRTEPPLISQLVRIAILQISIQPVWEGLAKHRWTDAQLEELQKTLRSLNLLEDYGFTIRGERAFSNETMAQWRAGRYSATMEFEINPPAGLMPSGWLYQNQLTINRLHQDLSLPMVDVAKHRVYPVKFDAKEFPPALAKRSLFNVFARMLFPAVLNCAEKFAHAQTDVDLATVACALERYRLANGKYPQALDALTPRFLEKLPTDVINGQPLKYRLDDAGLPVIYSVGWNETDEGGTVGQAQNAKFPRVDVKKGDWVWRYPAK